MKNTLWISIPRNLYLTIEVAGVVTQDDLLKIRKQLGRWFDGLAESCDDPNLPSPSPLAKPTEPA